MMNSPFVMQQGMAMLDRPEIARAAEPRQRIESLYHLLFGRAPSEEEASIGLAFLESEGRIEHDADSPGVGGREKTTRRLSAWEKYAQVLLESNEFVFVD